MKLGSALSILPTRGLAALLFVLAVMWYAASSQNNAAAYLLLFVLTSVALVSIPHALANLSGIGATLESIKPTFAGQEISCPVEILNESATARHGIIVALSKKAKDRERIDSVSAGDADRVSLRFPAVCRGEYRIEQLWLTSAYPFGFVNAAKQIITSQTYIVYPKPAGDPAFPRALSFSTKSANLELGEGDDFAGVRAYVPGESQRHIDWKAVARGQSLKTKQFTVESEAELYVDLAAARQSDLEDRLSQLALWIIEAERARRPYGLRLTNLELAPALGQAHFHRCLHALALFK
jgi:uncharacterized protein (DUF58 family)